MKEKTKLLLMKALAALCLVLCFFPVFLLLGRSQLPKRRLAKQKAVNRLLRVRAHEIPDSELPKLLDEGLRSENARKRQMAEQVARRFGRRLGLLLLMLKTGERENRLARDDWDDSCWEFWKALDTVILTGGLASGMLGRRFKEYRKALGFSQQDIHRKTGVALSTISLFENGKGHGLSLTHLYLLLDALDLEMEPDTIIPDAFRSDLAGQWEKQNKRSRK